MSGIASVNRAAAESLTSAGLDATAIDAIATGLGLIHILQVYTSSMVAIAVWDWLVCLRTEWRYIWKKEWSMIKALYLWTRYYGLICFSINLWLFNGEFTEKQCKTLHYLIAATCMWTTLGSEAILAIRTYAFLGSQRWLGIMLILMILGQTSFLLYISTSAVYQVPLPPIVENMAGPCTASDKPGQHVVLGFWLAPVAFDLICTFLTIWKAISLQELAFSSPLIKVFISDGLGYFIAVSAVNILNAAFMFQRNPNLQNINSFLALVLSQVLCCRLVLNLMESSQKPEGSFSITNTHNSFHHPTIPEDLTVALETYQNATIPSGIPEEDEGHREDKSQAHLHRRIYTTDPQSGSQMDRKVGTIV